MSDSIEKFMFTQAIDKFSDIINNHYKNNEILSIPEYKDDIIMKFTLFISYFIPFIILIYLAFDYFIM